MSEPLTDERLAELEAAQRTAAELSTVSAGYGTANNFGGWTFPAPGHPDFEAMEAADRAADEARLAFDNLAWETVPALLAGYRRLRAELAEAARLLDTAAQLADHGQPLSSATLYAGADKVRAALAGGW